MACFLTEVIFLQIEKYIILHSYGILFTIKLEPSSEGKKSVIQK